MVALAADQRRGRARGRLAADGEPISADRSRKLEALGRRDAVRVEQVAEQLDALDQARPRARERRGGVDRVERARAERLELVPVRQRLLRGLVRVQAAGHHDHDLGARRGRAPPSVTTRESRPGSPATLRPPANSIISGTQ